MMTTNKKMMGLVGMFLVIGLFGGCAKKVSPPEVETPAPAAAAPAPAAKSSESAVQEAPAPAAPAAEGKVSEFTPKDTGSQEARGMTFEENPAMGDVHFAFDKSDLDEKAKKTLQANAEWLKSHADVKSEIQGHCDERGTSNYNLALGERRAAAVKKYLAALGVDEKRLYTISYGKERPQCSEHKESCWSKNRRAHSLTSK